LRSASQNASSISRDSEPFPPFLFDGDDYMVMAVIELSQNPNVGIERNDAGA
jgi:hypothetical protein